MEGRRERRVSNCGGHAGAGAPEVEPWRMGGSRRRPRNPRADRQPRDFGSAGGGRPAGRLAETPGTREERPLLPGALARQIAERGGGHADADSLPRANRLAAQLLPDTLEFDPSRPGGFTFAAMNGRKPGDAIDPIVRTILAGEPRRGDATNGTQRPTSFPFVTVSAPDLRGHDVPSFRHANCPGRPADQRLRLLPLRRIASPQSWR